MNRRSFLLGLGAAAAAVTAPVKALARHVRPVTIDVEIISPKLTALRAEISREYIRQHLFSPFIEGELLYNGVIVRESPQLELFPGAATGMRTMGFELPGVTEWIDEDNYDDEEDYD